MVATAVAASMVAAAIEASIEALMMAAAMEASMVAVKDVALTAVVRAVVSTATAAAVGETVKPVLIPLSNVGIVALVKLCATNFSTHGSRLEKADTSSTARLCSWC